MTDPYATVADFYDAEFQPANADVSWFARVGAGGPLLVLGCGTGRVTAPLSALRPVTGLDRSEPMLARARARGDGARYVAGDLRSFDVGIFAEIILPNAAYAFLHSRADQLACLSACARALPSGGSLIIDVPAPDFERLAEPHTPERLAWEGLLHGQPARRTREVTRRPLAGRLDLLDRYWLGETLVGTSLLELQLSTPRELEWACEAAGFWVDSLHGDYTGRPLHEGCPRILVKAYRC
jgi:SAM-dependent methyltransferase